MKKPFIPAIRHLFFLLLLHSASIAQTNSKTAQPEKFGIDFDLGLTIPSAKDVSNVFYTGGNISLGFKMAVLNSKKLWIKPVGGIKLYSKKAGDEKGVQETFRTVKAGIELQYRVAERKKYSFYPVLRVDHNWCSNYFSKTYDYDFSTNSQTIAVSDKFLKGTGYSFDAGIMIVRAPVFYLKIDYEYFKPSLNVHPDFIREALAAGIAVPASTPFNCSTVNIGVGVNLNFK